MFGDSYPYSGYKWDIWFAKCKKMLEKEPRFQPFGVLSDHLWVAFLLHFIAFSLLAETGADGLEPARIGFFWAPILAYFMSMPPAGRELPVGYVGLWMRLHPNLTFWLNWTFSAVLFPIPIWPILKDIDEGLAHPLREDIGRGLGLGGQTGLLIFLCCVIGTIAIWHEYAMWKEDNRRDARKYWSNNG